MDLLQHVQKWREAHPSLQLPEDALKVAGPWPSLFANDFIVMLEAKGTMPEVVQFVKDISREMAWAYDNWKKTLHDSDASRLMIALINGARGPGESAAAYQPIVRYLTDYAKANGILVNGGPAAASWEGLIAAASSGEQIAPAGDIEVVR